MSEWVVLCSDADFDEVTRTVASIDRHATISRARSQDDLRRRAATSRTDGVSVMVGATGERVSEINLAAAVAKDGRARFVGIAKRGASGSFRSRAARAGIGLVVDLNDVGDETPAADVGGEVPAALGRRVGVGGGAPDRRQSEGVPVLGAARVEAPPVARGLSRQRSNAVADLMLDLDEPSGSAAPALAPVLVLCSGRGGVGKTTIAVCSAVIAGRWGLRVCLLDLDLSCGNAHALLGLPGGPDLASLGKTGPGPLAQLSQTSPSGVSLIGPCARPETAELVFPHVGSLIEEASKEFDLVIVDTSTTFTDAVAQAAQRADRLVIVTDSREGSIAAAARTSGLAVRLGVARTRIARIENRANPRFKPDLSLGRAEVGLETARVYRVFEGGRDVGGLLGEGKAAELCEPGSALADSLASGLAKLLAELGRLPDCDEAREAYERTDEGRRLPLFVPRREAR